MKRNAEPGTVTGASTDLKGAAEVRYMLLGRPSHSESGFRTEVY